MSNKAEKAHIIIEAGCKSRKLVSKPLAYLSHKIVSKIKAPPVGSPPKRKDKPKEIPKIHRISVRGILKLE